MCTYIYLLLSVITASQIPILSCLFIGIPREAKFCLVYLSEPKFHSWWALKIRQKKKKKRRTCLRKIITRYYHSYSWFFLALCVNVNSFPSPFLPTQKLYQTGDINVFNALQQKLTLWSTTCSKGGNNSINASKHFTGESFWISIVQNYLFFPSPIKGGGGEALAEKYSVADICCVKIELSCDKNV